VSDPPVTPLRLGVLGCGRVFQRFHLPAIARVPTITLTAACDTDPTRLTWSLPGAPTPTFFGSPTELLSHNRLDALLILTPPSDHAVAVVRAVQRGLHVLVEKPMALDPTAAGDMIHAARQAQRHLQVGFSRRFREPYRRLRAALEGLGPGQIRGVRFELAFPTGSWKAETDFLGDEARGGGVLDDVLSHQVDLVSWILGVAPDEVRAMANGSAESSFEAHLRLGNLTVHCEAAHARYLEHLEIELADGTVLEASGSQMRKSGVRFAGWRRRRALLADRLALARDRLLRRSNASLVSFERQLRDFESAVRGGKSEGATGEDGLLTVKVVQACRASVRQGGAWLRV
jgi:predicted dehydrogenase